MENTLQKKESLLIRLLNKIEVLGNKLPNPVTIFVYLCLVVVIVSLIASLNNLEVINPATNESIKAINLLSVEQLGLFLGNIVGNFQSFPPLGLVLVVMIGAGVAEKTRFMETAMKATIINLPPSFLTYMVILIGIVANAAGDAGFIILPPLAAVLFLTTNRHPLIGLFAAYAGVAAGFSANLLVSMLDVLLASFTIPAAESVDPSYANIATPAMNWYFLIVSTIFLSITATIITEKIIAPRFNNEDLAQFKKDSQSDNQLITVSEKKALNKAFIAVVIYLIIILLLALVPLNSIPFIPQQYSNAFLAGPGGKLLETNAPFMRGLVPIITLLFFIPGVVYGKATKQIKTDHDIVRIIGQSLSEMGPYILLAFMASQFIALFNQSNLGIVLAVTGADFLKNIGFTGGPLFVSFILFCAFLNLFIGSASAKWAMLAPIFVPMFLLLGYDPAITQMAYRIGDSVTNPISPLFTYFPMIVGFVAKYKKDAGVGTIISNMLPYSFVFTIIWVIIF
ncbi:MAG: AbgT family transporter, partial [Bacilli bacterium]